MIGMFLVAVLQVFCGVNSDNIDAKAEDSHITTTLHINTAKPVVEMKDVPYTDRNVIQSGESTDDVYANALCILTGVPADGNTDKIYCEGKTAKLNVKFEPAFTLASEAYVFLEPQNADSLNLVESVNFTRGSRITSGTSITTIPLTIYLLDGTVKSQQNGLRFKLKLRTEETISGGRPVEGYISTDYVLYVTNVVPTVQTVYMDGVFEPQLQTDGTLLMSGEVAVNIRKEFTYVPNDDEVRADYTNNQFTSKWTFYDGGISFTTNVVGNPYISDVPYTFINAGKHKVTVQLQDKDLKAEGDMKFGPTYTFYVDVKDAPAIELFPHDGSMTFTEEQDGENARIDVKLTLTPDAPIDVQLAVSRLGVGSNPKIYPLPTLSTNIVHFAKGKSEAFFNLKDLDGTLFGSIEGYKITARVITTDVSPSIGLPFNEIYEPVEDFSFYLENVYPEIILPDPNDTNEYVITLGNEQVIKWEVSDACNADLQAGLTVTIMTSEGGCYSYTTTTGTGEFKNKFATIGSHWISFQVEDKDGGTSALVRKFYNCGLELAFSNLDSSLSISGNWLKEQGFEGEVSNLETIAGELQKTGKNNIPIYESYILGLVPNSEETASEQLKAVIEGFDENGNPVISCEPKPNVPNHVTIKKLGRETLPTTDDNKWEEIKDNKQYKYFKVLVEIH